MKYKIIHILIFAFFIIPHNGFSQKKSDLLKKQEQALLRKIENTKLLIRQTKNSEKLTMTELGIINRQISYREKLIRNYNFQLTRLDANITSINRQINALENTEKVLKEEYKKMLIYAFKNRDPNYKFLYIISASTFTEAFHRMKYIQHYADYRAKQVERIQKTQQELIYKKKELDNENHKKQNLIVTKKDEKSSYLNDKISQTETLNALKEDEQTLIDKLKEDNTKRREISKAIRSAIEKELKKTSNKKESRFSLTPEGVAISKKFSANKGQLNWPVERGEITGSYGKHQHHLVSTATIDNNGIDITTIKNSSVRSVFNGKVTSVLIIPGAGKVVMISHGEYRTIYANLQEVIVKKGEMVFEKQTIGKLLEKDNGISESHFEIWKISSSAMNTVNPSIWLKK